MLLPLLKFTDYFLVPVPGFVTSPVAFSFGKDWIDLRWQAPYPPNGETEMYKVEYKLESSWLYSMKKVSANKTCTLWEGSICITLDANDGIMGNEDYSIKVGDI